MNRIRKKLRDRSGASILMALLLMLVAVMVSVVILTAAVSAAKTVRTDRDQQQSYLTVSSAAALVRDSVLGGSGSYEIQVTEIYSDKNYKTLYEGPETTVTEAKGSFSSILNDALAVVLADPTKTYTETCTIQDTNGLYEKVTAVFTLSAAESEADGKTNYTLRVDVSAADPGEHPCKMTLTMTGLEQVDESTDTLESYIPKQWIWTYYVDAYRRITTTSVDWSQTSAVITRERAVQG